MLTVVRVLAFGFNQTWHTWNADLVATNTDPRNLLTTLYWDNLRRLTGISYPDGTTISNIYTALDVTARKDRLGQWSYSGFNGLRQLVAATNENGVVTRYGYCDCGALLSQTNAWNTPVQQVITFAYDFQGNRLRTFYPDAYAVTNWFDSLERVTTTSDGSTYRYFYYNNQSLVTNVLNSLVTEQQTLFDNEDRPQYVTDINGVTVTNTYDKLNRVLTRGYPDGGVEHFYYSARGLVAYTNQLGFGTEYAYDAAGRKTSETDANNEILLYTNSAAGDLLSLTDDAGRSTRWTYDQYGRVTNKLDQAGTVILIYTYDPDNRLTNRWSAAKGNTAYTYDAVGNLILIKYPSSPSVTLQYDALNRLITMVDAIGTNTFSYTAGNQLLTETGPWASDTLTNTYVNRLRVALGLQQPTGSWTNGFGWDGAVRLTNVASPAGTFSYTYDAVRSSLPKRILLPNTAYITNFFDPNARTLGTLLNNSGNTTLDGATYSYNTAGQRTQMRRTDNSTVTYTYDPISQLKTALGSGGQSTENLGYTYDVAWNLNYLTNGGSTTAFTNNSRNELTSVAGLRCLYDANGNITQFGDPTITGGIDYSYDDENRLSEVDTNYNVGAGPLVGSTMAWETTFTYDGLGRLRKRLEYVYGVLQSTTTYLYDGFRVIQERDVNNVPSVSYTRGPDLSGSFEGAGGIGGLLSRSIWSGHAWTSHAYYHADANGNITYLADSSQGLAASYVYDPFGNTTYTNGPLAAANVYRFSSKECHVNSGMYYYLERFYATTLQRWINRDPVGEPGGINLYAYADNDPLSRVDPFGLCGGGDRDLKDCFAQALAQYAAGTMNGIGHAVVKHTIWSSISAVATLVGVGAAVGTAGAVVATPPGAIAEGVIAVNDVILGGVPIHEMERNKNEQKELFKRRLNDCAKNSSDLDAQKQADNFYAKNAH